VYTPSVRKYAIFDIAESRIFFSSECTKLFVAGLRPDPLGELTALPRPPSCIRRSYFMRGEGRGEKRGEERGGEMLRTPMENS